MFNGDHEQIELICNNDVMDAIIDRFGEDVLVYAHDMTSFRAIVNVATSHIFTAGSLHLVVKSNFAVLRQ